MPKKVIVDPEKCIGCQLCPDIAPDTFEMQGDKAVTKRDTVDESSKEEEAKDSCPTEAISLSD
jgi:ferredoxin